MSENQGPEARQAVAEVRVLTDRVVVSYTDSVRGRAAVFRDRGEWGWPRTDIAMPDNLAVSLGDSSKSRGEVFVSTQGFLVPPTLSLADANAATLTTLKSASAKFDASRDVTEQYEATSADGTKIPYFITHPRDMKLDGSNPTIMLGYGGFQISLNPAYKPEMGKLWLERGVELGRGRLQRRQGRGVGVGQAERRWDQDALGRDEHLAARLG